MKLKYNEAKNNKTSISYDNSVMGERPIFCFEIISEHYLNNNNMKLLEDPEASHLFLSKIEKLSKMTWNQIYQTPKSAGYESIPLTRIKGCNWLKENLKEKGKKKVDVFRVKNKTTMRILGLCEHKIFKIYCYDKNGVAYSHGS